VRADRLDPAGENLLRELAPQVLGAVVRRFGDFSAAEDAVQEALLAAATQWPDEGLPDNPRGWLIHVAARRMTDQLRADIARRRRETAVVTEATTEQTSPEPDLPALHALVSTIGSSSTRRPSTSEDAFNRRDVIDQDDTLIVLFMCCHPALTRASAIALTLRAVGGLTTLEIANAFLVPEATMAQRISRAKQRIKSSGVPFRMPTASERDERVAAVLHVLYLIFNEGYTSSIGPHLQRTDLSNEAIRLTRAVRAIRPDNGVVAGLLALMLLTDARRPARAGPDGELIPLAAQNRTLWDRDAIAEGVSIISDTLSKGSIGAYQLQAAIAAVHDEAGRAEDTDWPQILALYGLLKRMSDNPMVTLNHAIAAAMVHGPAAGLQLLQVLDADPRMANHYRLDAVRAHLLEMSGDRSAAVERYQSAAARTTSIPERNYLLTQAARLRDASALRGNLPS
jgi:RNA polymerase sigma factor (sigma-70 family)